jgi:hypothetical protein
MLERLRRASRDAYYRLGAGIGNPPPNPIPAPERRRRLWLVLTACVIGGVSFFLRQHH